MNLYTFRRISPICPKCKNENTYDIIPGIANTPEDQLAEDVFEYTQEKTVGNAKYYCKDCSHTWKKYRGKKPYEQIKVIYANVGGFPGPYSEVKIDFENLGIERSSSKLEIILKSPTKEDFEWFRSELYKCDFLNWAEEYYQMFVCDGTHWSVRIEYENHCEIKTGHVHYPSKWTKFCKAVEKISGGEFY